MPRGMPISVARRSAAVASTAVLSARSLTIALTGRSEYRVSEGKLVYIADFSE